MIRDILQAWMAGVEPSRPIASDLREEVAEKKTMARDLDPFSEDEHEGWSGGGFASAEAGGRRFRFLPHLGRGLAAAAIFVGLCVVFGGDESTTPTRGAERTALSGDFGVVGTLNFGSSGEILLSSSWDKTVRVWDVGAWTGEFGEELARLPASAEIYDAAISPDSRMIATAGVRGVAFWNWREGKSEAETVADLAASRALAFAPDGRSLAVGGSDGKVRLLDTRSRQSRLLFEDRSGAIRKLWITADGSLLIALGYGGDLKFWDWRSERLVEKIKGGAESILSVSPSPDGTMIALSRYWQERGEIEIWDLETGRLKMKCRGHEGMVHALAFSRGGGALASAGSDLRIRLWNTETGRPLGEVEGVDEWVRVLKFSIDDQWLVYAGARDRVQFKRLAPAMGALQGPRIARGG